MNLRILQLLHRPLPFKKRQASSENDGFYRKIQLVQKSVLKTVGIRLRTAQDADFLPSSFFEICREKFFCRITKREVRAFFLDSSYLSREDDAIPPTQGLSSGFIGISSHNDRVARIQKPAQEFLNTKNASRRALS